MNVLFVFYKTFSQVFFFETWKFHFPVILACSDSNNRLERVPKNRIPSSFDVFAFIISLLLSINFIKFEFINKVIKRFDFWTCSQARYVISVPWTAVAKWPEFLPRPRQTNSRKKTHSKRCIPRLTPFQ